MNTPRHNFRASIALTAMTLAAAASQAFAQTAKKGQKYSSGSVQISLREKGRSSKLMSGPMTRPNRRARNLELASREILSPGIVVAAGTPNTKGVVKRHEHINADYIFWTNYRV